MVECNSALLIYEYFYCLGRQRYKNGCTFRAAPVDSVERLVEDHWATVTLAYEYREDIRSQILDHMAMVLPEQANVRRRCQERLTTLEDESKKLLQAFYADAIPVDALKQEQARIALAKGKAQTELDKAVVSEERLVKQLDTLLDLLGHAHQYYVGSDVNGRRDLNQAVFSRILVDDDEIVGTDLQPVVRRLISPRLSDELMVERNLQLSWRTEAGPTSDLYLVAPIADDDQSGANGSADLPSRARRLRGTLPVRDSLPQERPRGKLPWERKNLCPRKGTGSNELLLVAGAGFEPAASGL